MQNLFVIVNQVPTHNVIAPGVLYYRGYSPENAAPVATAEANPHFIGYHKRTTHQIWGGNFHTQAQDVTVATILAAAAPAHITVIPHYDVSHRMLISQRLYYSHRAGDAFIAPAAQPDTSINFLAKHQPTQYRPFRTGSRDYNEGNNVPIPSTQNRTTGTPPVIPTSAVPSTPLVPTMQGNWQEYTRQIAQATNRTIQRSSNVTLDVTLRANQTTTTITDARISAFSAIIPAMAKTASAATALASGSVYVDTIIKGSAVVHHPSNAAIDQTIRFVIMGA